MRFRTTKCQFITFATGLILCSGVSTANAQDCPENIDFETGTFANWNCYVGNVSVQGGQNSINLVNSNGPVPNRHTMYNSNSAGIMDEYGGFPVLCPNGSGHSIRLGNNSAGTEAEGISYDFIIPSNQNVYSLIYHYAVVFEDPDHQVFEQPRLEIEILNVSDNTVINCSSFTFIPYGSLLPGFFESQHRSGDAPVWCKNWSAVTINLNGLAGKAIRLFFKTADCTFRRHFGYAYIDVNSECSSEFLGASYCPDDTLVNLTAPYGYQNYTWFNNTFTQQLGSAQTITFSPVPAVGSTYAVVVVPYNGYGCLDTLYAKLMDTLKVKSIAGDDVLSCNQNPVMIGGNSKPGLVYSWSPTTGLTNPSISNPLASPNVTTNYILSTRHDGGGCLHTDTVIVTASIIDNAMHLTGSASFCSDSEDSAILHVQPNYTVQWYKDDRAITGSSQKDFHVHQTGTYYAILTNHDGCTINTAKQDIIIDSPIPGIRYPVQYAVIDQPLPLKARQIGINVLWNPGAYLNTPATFTPIFTGRYEQLYTIEMTTRGGCVTIDTQLVKTVKQAEIYVPTAFTPNRDGLNDYLNPIIMGIREIRYFRIFNRWGQLVYEMKNSDKGWDGTINGTPQPSQVVVWMVEGVGFDNRVYQRKGTTALVR